MSKTACILFFMLLCCCAAKAQNNIRGQVKDSAGNTIQGVTIQVAEGKDTLYTISDKEGKFRFSKINSNFFRLFISATSYQPFSNTYQLKEGQHDLEVETIVLLVQGHELGNVVVKSVITPVTIKEDTVEYDARAYIIREGDMVENLLKQLPGIEVDKNGNVKADGKEMTKLRVNGKDFFTSDVATFIKQLPAHIISKLQVIEDYGDEAGFTGVKSGEPRKMLNLVVKPGMNKGTFGNADLKAATNGLRGIGAAENIWRDTRQMSVNANLSSSDNKDYVSTGSGISFTYRDNWSKKLSVNAEYGYNAGQNKNTGSSFRQTIYPFGNLYTLSENAWNNVTNGHNLSVGMNYNLSKSTYLNINASVNLSKSTNGSTTTSKQTGIFMQDLYNSSSSLQSNSGTSAFVSFGHRFNKQGRVLSGGINFNASANAGDQQLTDHTLYYDTVTSLVIKDSLLERLVNSGNNSYTLGINIRYSEPISKKSNLDVSYNYNGSLSHNRMLTNVSNSPGKYAYVDSLSNVSHNIFAGHRLGLNYRYAVKGLSISTGLQLQPNVIEGQYEGRKTDIRHATFNFSPSSSVHYTLSKTSSLNIGYSGQSNSPNIYQLQPVKDSRNLQNIIVGNPDLKTAFSSRGNLSYSKRLSKKGSLFSIGINGSTVHNQVVSNVILVHDPQLGNLRQETHYLNVNGGMNMGSNYNFSQPISNNKMVIDLSGTYGYGKNISYADDVKNEGRNLRLSQSLRFRINTKWLSTSSGIQYTSSNNRFAIGNGIANKVEAWDFNISNSFYLSKSISAGFDAGKQVNKGYYKPISKNPVSINANASLTFLRKKTASLQIQVYDLLNSGNNPGRTISDNSITDVRTNFITRYVTLNCAFRLSHFGD